ncbi:MAG TPA: hypothetical protein DIU39_08725 [Flavobacteriales bacterium]|nr:hypothetical protein [Flavobacteriales bacterium]
MKSINYILAVCLIFISFFSNSETIDTTEYFNKVDEIIKLRNVNLDSSLAKAKSLETQLNLLDNYPALKTHAQNQIAISYALVGDIVTAHKYFKLNTEGDTSKLSNQTKGSIFNNLAISYMDLGKYSDAINNLLVSLKYREKLKDNSEIAASYSNLGLCYFRQDLYNKALAVYYKGLNTVMHPVFKDTSLFTKIHNNIGLIYLDKKQLDSAEYHFNISKKYLETINESYDLCGIYAYLSELYLQKNDMNKAVEYNQKALKLAKVIGNDYDYYLSLIDLAQIYFYNNQFDKVKPLLDTLYKYYSFRKDKWQLINIYDFYADYYKKSGDYKKALAYKDSVIILKDSIFTSESINKQRELEAIYENEKQQLLIENLSKENEAKNAQIAKQNTQKIAFSVGLTLMLVIALISIKAYKNKSKSQKLITIQKNAIEAKNIEITDSIQYAKRIQKAILPPENLIKKYLPNSFILYKPKDIVSGDFYWLESVDNLVFFAVADCTGHGVPGAMVSVVCSSVLSKAVIEEKIYLTDKILNRAKALIIERFERSDQNISDGMDISLCCLNTDTLELNWSGANNPLYIYREKELIEFKPDKQPVGKSLKHAPFTMHTIQLKKGDALYLFTDGFADQFGGPKGKKLKYKPFKELLLSIQDLPMEEQKTKLENFFNEWKGNLEQVDDVCIFGVKV